MKAAIYCRVSTDDKGQDPKVQLDKCRQYCEMHQHQIIEEFLDEGVSGDTFYYERLNGKRLHDSIKSNKVDCLVVFALDRFSRQSPLTILPMLNHLKDQGIKFISVTEPIFNMESEFAEPMRYMLSWFANYFLKQHKTKVEAGIKKARKYGTKSGKSIGRERKADYEKIKESYLLTQSMSATAKQLGINKSSVFNALKRFKRESL